ncbi:hypothetical protein LDENG_00127010 [Lucifuga dentata]|nr:hypothetical protein LDENG_00127010 [Lucifuga dentata]
MKFTKNHIHQHAVSTARNASRSSAASFETIYKKAKYLPNKPVATLLIRAVRADQKMQGYQFAAYFDKPTSRMQLIVASLAESDKWRICADGVLLSYHKVMAKLAWGIECKEYQTEITAETGAVDKSPALRMKAIWNKTPRAIKKYAKEIFRYIERIAEPAAARLLRVKNNKEFTLTAIATSEKTLDFVLKSKWRIIYKLDVSLPFYVPIGKTAAELDTLQDNWADRVSYLITKAHAAECTLTESTVTTFNGKKFEHQIPDSCYQVLAQDCTPELKFMVLLKKDIINEQKQITIKIADIDVDMYQKNNNVMVKVNGMDIPINNLPYQNPREKIHISRSGDGIVLHAPSFGLQEIYFDLNMCKVQVVDWMRAKTCGLCGKADGEVRQEFRTPSGHISKSAVSYGHSWILPSSSCRDSAGCQLKLESVKLDRQVNIHGQESKCYSVEPVMRCVPGCMPLRTTSISVGYHCVPASSNLERSDNIYEKSVDLKDKAEAHLACRCTPQCA